MVMTDSRPVCVYAMAGLKKNSTRLLITLCVGIALAMYGVYVQARIKSNPSYMSTISMAAHWMYNCLGNKLAHPSKIMKSCQSGKTMGQTVPHFLMRAIVSPIIQYSGMMNGFINLTQIILLKVYCRSLPGTMAIIGLSAFGGLISLICMIGAIFTCKIMCISCIGIHHGVIIYLAMCRYRIIKNLLCPPNNTNEGACIFGNASGTVGRVTGSSTSSSDIRRRKN